MSCIVHAVTRLNGGFVGSESINLPVLLGGLGQLPPGVNLHINQVHIHLSPSPLVEATDQFQALPPAEPEPEPDVKVERPSRSNGRTPWEGFLRRGSHRPGMLKPSIRG